MSQATKGRPVKRAMSIGMEVLLCAALAVSAGCDGTVRIDDAENGGIVTLAVGETLTVVLESNPTTGYSWSAIEVPSCMEQDGGSEYDSDAPPGMMGAGGEETWRFTAVELGEGTLVLEYARPWETGVEAVEVYEVDVTVE